MKNWLLNSWKTSFLLVGLFIVLFFVAGFIFTTTGIRFEDSFVPCPMTQGEIFSGVFKTCVSQEYLRQQKLQNTFLIVWFFGMIISLANGVISGIYFLLNKPKASKKKKK